VQAMLRPEIPHSPETVTVCIVKTNIRVLQAFHAKRYATGTGIDSSRESEVRRAPQSGSTANLGFRVNLGAASSVWVLKGWFSDLLC
jgi:hypothetical protein